MSKVNRFLFVILLALSGLLVVLEKPWAIDKFTEAEARRGARIFAEFEPAKAVKIELSHAGSQVVLQKAGAGWTIPSLSNFRANEDAVARLLERIRSMTKGDLVTQDPSNFVKYRVQESEAPHVKVLDGSGQAIADFYQGRPYFDPEAAQQSNGRLTSLDCYVRAAGSNDVYRVGDFHPIEPVRANDWIPRNLYRFEIPAIQTLTLTGTELGEEFALNHSPNGEWELVTPTGPVPANREACDTLARSISSLYLEEILGAFDPKEAVKYGFDKPRFRAFAVLSGGGNEELMIGLDAPKQGDVAETAYATGGLARSHVAKVFKSSVEALKVTRAQLLAVKSAGDGTVSGPASGPAMGTASAPVVSETQPASTPASKPK